jgi:predicted metal-dependent phosphoesterase TrpH
LANGIAVWVRRMIRLKADLHAHSGDDRVDSIAYPSERLIDAVAERGYQVLAITNHEHMTFRRSHADYARERGVLLVPGFEPRIGGKHVVILNPDGEQASARSFAELRAMGRRNAAVIAPHPFYPVPESLGRRLVENIDLFDAVEYSSFYFRKAGFNRRAAEVASRHGLPLIGTSDCHVMPHTDSTFSWIDVEEATVEGVIDAVRAGRITLVTRPVSPGVGIRIGFYQLLLGSNVLMKRRRGRPVGGTGNP